MEQLLNLFRDGCGTTKACLFKPSGCDPNLDCTIGLIFFVVGPNQLRMEMVATSLIPAVQQQYIAIAFSNDAIMQLTKAEQTRPLLFIVNEWAFLLITLPLNLFRDGCGTTKACLFKPSGCDPNLDCTIGLIFFVVGPNQLRMEMVATSLIPAVQQQYIAIAFSNDAIMGDDFVTECVLSDMGQFAGWEPEIFVSFNHGKANDRIYLNDDEHNQLITNVSSQVVDGRLVCQFTQQIVPQIDRRNGLIWSLDKPFYIMGATGSAQPDGKFNGRELQ
ncbi:unnamed protein product [Haemonchus placei]|uniref:Ig-like domain-containing protein n=1 Tax=Haemonchus placei TaxID=6290 RepID=A0A0N4WF16_HAEPC|nr:unnamed protein product [Haemonchus placei]